MVVTEVVVVVTSEDVVVMVLIVKGVNEEVVLTNCEDDDDSGRCGIGWYMCEVEVSASMIVGVDCQIFLLSDSRFCHFG
ncbi:unnamed protein product [Lactuca virosa]|uniref:Uncharacterized protein n=1 Tax=Lactuca virosa TaxID=75947 RepID=A0AAU9LE15_9ASTR|nr:unnamed protein product [Lactuca virosa]